MATTIHFYLYFEQQINEENRENHKDHLHLQRLG